MGKICGEGDRCKKKDDMGGSPGEKGKTTYRQSCKRGSEGGKGGGEVPNTPRVHGQESLRRKWNSRVREVGVVGRIRRFFLTEKIEESCSTLPEKGNMAGEENPGLDIETDKKEDVPQGKKRRKAIASIAGNLYVRRKHMAMLWSWGLKRGGMS